MFVEKLNQVSPMTEWILILGVQCTAFVECIETKWGMIQRKEISHHHHLENVTVVLLQAGSINIQQEKEI